MNTATRAQLFSLVYEELRKLAAQRLAEEKPGQTLQATALVHEAYLRLVGADKVQRWTSRGHFFRDSKGALDQQVNAVTFSNLQDAVTQALKSGSPIVVQADPMQVKSLVDAVNGLQKSSVPVTVTVNLTAGSFTDITASPPAGVTLVIDGKGATTTFVGKSPALTVVSGTVIVTCVTFTTATGSPTIVVTGGTLILRNSTVQESTGFAAAALAVTGGTLDLGTTASPGGNTLNVNGAGNLIRSSSAGAVSAIGNIFQVDGTTLSSNFRIEDRITHGLDTTGFGLVRRPGDTSCRRHRRR